MAWLLGLTALVNQNSRCTASIERLIQSLGMPAKKEQGGIWTLLADIRDTYQVRLSVFTRDQKLHLIASSEACIERDLISREILLMLLEWNSRLENSSFRLVEMDESRIIAISRAIDVRNFPPDELTTAARNIVETMQLFICKGVAMGGLIQGPHVPQ